MWRLAASLPMYPTERRGWPRFWELRRDEIITANTWYCGVGFRRPLGAIRAFAHLKVNWIWAHCVCWRLMRPQM
jgi:hypothetical protein